MQEIQEEEKEKVKEEASVKGRVRGMRGQPPHGLGDARVLYKRSPLAA